MDQRLYRRKTKVLWGLSLVLMIYSLWLYRLHTLTSVNTLDGIIGVVLGLYICSHPVANAKSRKEKT